MNKKKLLILGIRLCTIVAFCIFASNNYIHKQLANEVSLYAFLGQQYSNNFTLKTLPIGNFLVSSANSNTTCCGEGTTGSFDSKATPAIITQDLKSQKIKSIYEVSFTTNAADGKFNKGNIIQISAITQVKDYLVAEWSINYGGSGGLKGLVIFGNKNGQFQPITGYPFPNNPKSSINLIDKLSNKKYAFPITVDTYFSEVRDLNKDGKLDFLFADWKWDLKNGEAHYESRPWNLQVFELVNSKFRVAKWWNKGEIYKTPEDIGYTESDNARINQIFYEKFK